MSGIEQWIVSARSLTQSSSVPLGVPVTLHTDMLLRDTQGRLLDALGALEAVLELADGWTSRGEHLMAYSKTVPDEIGVSLLEAGADFVERARILRQTVESTLSIKEDNGCEKS